ncbi:MULTISPECIES: hypothetical protein [Cysteiniphilum]|uniref:hypothetical protein n=1 Tax=Cysteiniphilum TaxID=2056696 RepID=UPI00177DF468|nr:MULTISPECIES: hypothetical protein [Cysteiniphilum]
MHLTLLTKFALKDQDGIVCVFDTDYRTCLLGYECVDEVTGDEITFNKDDISQFFNGGSHDGKVIKGDVVFEIKIIDFVTDKTTRQQYEEYLDEFDFCSMNFATFKKMRRAGRA